MKSRHFRMRHLEVDVHPGGLLAFAGFVVVLAVATGVLGRGAGVLTGIAGLGVETLLWTGMLRGRRSPAPGR